MKRRCLIRHLGRFGAVFAASWLGGCAPAPTLQVAMHPWVGYESLRLARAFHWLDDAVVLRETKDLSASAAALQGGQVDAACLTLDEVLRLRGKGLALTVATVFDVSNGADMVLSQGWVPSLSALRGKRIAVERGTLGSLMLARLLQAAHLTAQDVVLIDLAPDQQIDAWGRQEVDAVITYEPFGTLLLRRGAHRLFDSRLMPETIFDVLAIRHDRLEARAAALRALVAAHFRGLEHINASRDDAVYRIATSQGMTPDEVRQALVGVILPSLQANREYLSARTGKLEAASAALSHVMVQTGLLAREDDGVQLVSAQWLPGEGAT